MGHRPSPQVVLAGFYPPPFGGESVHVSKLAARLRSAGMLKHVVNLRRGSEASPDYLNGAAPTRFWLALIRLLSRDTLLHLHSNGHGWKSWGMILSAACALRMRRAAGVLTLHSGLCPQFLDRANAVSAIVLRSSLAAFARIICVNDDIRRSLVRLRVPDTRLLVIPAFLGVTNHLVGEIDGTLVGAFHPLLCVVAGTGPEYGLPVFLEALSRLRAEAPQIGCLIVGTRGEDGAADLTQRLGLAAHVRFLGPLPHDHCVALMAKSDVFVRPSLKDGDAVSVREALQLAVPVVASNTSSRPAGVSLFQVGDSRDLARTVSRVIREGIPRSAGETPPDYGKALLALYQRVVEARA